MKKTAHKLQNPEKRNQISKGKVSSGNSSANQKKVKKPLLASEQKYRVIIENALYAFLLTKPDGTILEANKAACDLFGYTQEEFQSVGRHGIIAHSGQAFEKILREKGQTKGEITAIKKNGEKFPCEYSSVVFKNIEGEDRVSTILADISDRKKQEKEIKEGSLNMKMILDNTEQSFFVIDRTLRIIAYNKVASDESAKFLGRSFTAGDSILDFAKPERKEELKLLYREILKGVSKQYTYALPIYNNEINHTELKYVPVRDDTGDVIAIMINSRNVSKEKHLEEELKRSEARFRGAFEHSAIGMALVSLDGRWLEVNESVCSIVGYTKQQLMKITFQDITHPEDISKDLAFLEHLVKGDIQSYNMEKRYIHKNGSIVWVILSVSMVKDIHDNPSYFVSQIQDITQRKQMELTLQKSEQEYKSLFEQNPDGVFSLDMTGRFTSVNEALVILAECSAEQLLSMDFIPFVDPGDIEVANHHFIEVQKGLPQKYDIKAISANGTPKVLNITNMPIVTDGQITGVYGIVKDITQTRRLLELRRLEKEVLEMNIQQNNKLEDILSFYLKEIEKIHDGMRCSVLRLEGNRLFSWASPSLPQKYIDAIEGLHIGNNTGSCGTSAYTKEKVITENIATDPLWKDYKVYALEHGLQSCWSFPIKDSKERVLGVFGIYYKQPKIPTSFEETTIEKATNLLQLIFENKDHENTILAINDALEKRAEELAASNTELERFAYIASHDLQEPLRMVSSFLQLLQKKYKDQLDETAEQYINFAVDGANRMKKLILDLLEYSRAGTSKDELADTDTNDTVKLIIEVFAGEIKTTGANIKVHPLPVVHASRSQMMQLFQNLLSNALKYNQAAVPEIEIGCIDKGDLWQFFIKDNGIGIDEKFFEKVFIIFQRLHNKNQFSGTGIGLAICKKIVERHGGTIWIESRTGTGTTFFFSIKK